MQVNRRRKKQRRTTTASAAIVYAHAWQTRAPQGRGVGAYLANLAGKLSGNADGSEGTPKMQMQASESRNKLHDSSLNWIGQ
jgi:hypothetical protein